MKQKNFRFHDTSAGEQFTLIFKKISWNTSHKYQTGKAP